MRARILKILSKDYTLQLENHEIVLAIAMGKLRKAHSPVVGDLVEVEKIDEDYAIQKIYPRKNSLIRPACANIDQAFIVMSVKDPDFCTSLIDRLTFLICNAGIEPILVVTKIDLGIDEETEKLIQEYERGPMRVIRTGKGCLDESFAYVFKDKISVLTGQSGAGKSTLLNQIDPSFHLATQEISKALGRGRHTTRHNELHEVAGGLVADTPGFSSLDFSKMDATQLAQAVPDFEGYLGDCKFNDCVHQNEPGCHIKKAVEEGLIPRTRYNNYLDVLTTIQTRREKF